MNHNSQSTNENRTLTDQESGLIRWLLENGEEHAAAFISQLASARVISRCTCGCASIYFAIAGRCAPTDDGMDILSDYCWQDPSGPLFGAFVFARGGLLAGLDRSIDGQATATYLPDPSELRPIESN